ncbi:MAG: cytochrome c biogenesis protein CcsA [Nitrospirae bacterium]|nr:cytochrome c biogenesis protein CcsA [Nitrospirota bacterium]
MKFEYIFFWIAAGLYGVSACSYIFGLISKQEKLFTFGLYSALAGFVPHLASIGRRWMETGIEPFITISESITFGIFMAVLIYLIFQFATEKVRPLGVLIMPVAFVLMGWAGTLIKDAATQIAPALQSWWIWVHIIGAATGFGSVLAAAGLGLMYLLKEKYSAGIYEKLPEPQALDNLAYRFVAGGFIMYGLMIVSGAFWSNQVKGNYWNWDPVEVWSLISWLTYGIYLHLRATFGWRGRKLAWYALIALAAMIISYWGIPFTVETFHAGFRIQH